MDENNKFIEPVIFDNPNEQEDRFDPITGRNREGLIKPIDFDVKNKSIEEKIYIILYKLASDEDDDIYTQIFSVCIGRTEAFGDIKDKLLSGLEIDVHASKIITETKQTEYKTNDRKYYLLPYDESISIYSFCKMIEDFYTDDPFSIEEFNNTEIEEEDQILSQSKFYLTAEQQEYRDMLNEALKSDKSNMSIVSEDNNI